MTVIAIIAWTIVLAAGVGALLLGLRDNPTDRTTGSPGRTLQLTDRSAR